MQAILFSESHSRFAVSIKPENKERFENLFGDMSTFIGEVDISKRLKIYNESKSLIDLKVAKLQKAWDEGLKI